MKKLNFYSSSLIAAFILFITSLIFIISGNIVNAGIPIIAFFCLLAIGFNGFKSYSGYTFTALLFAAIVLSLYFPQYFISFKGYQFTNLIVPLIQIIMFGMGISMSPKDFSAVIKSPKAVIIGVSAQLGIMPFIGFLLAKFSGFPPEIAAGIVLIGASPSGVASNVIAYLAKANIALSITITTIATLIAPFATPILMKFLAGEFVEIDVLSMMWTIIKMIIIPIGAGLIFNQIFGKKTIIFNKIMPIVSMAGIAIIIVVITANGRDSLLEIGGLLLILVLTHNIAGYLIGYWYARLFKLSERDARTVAIEVGMQNGGLASGIANSIGKITTMGLAPAVFGPIMNITGSILASYWHKKDPDENVASIKTE